MGPVAPGLLCVGFTEVTANSAGAVLISSIVSLFWSVCDVLECCQLLLKQATCAALQAQGLIWLWFDSSTVGSCAVVTSGTHTCCECTWYAAK
jgi:hypothetical protein